MRGLSLSHMAWIIICESSIAATAGFIPKMRINIITNGSVSVGRTAIGGDDVHERLKEAWGRLENNALIGLQISRKHLEFIIKINREFNKFSKEWGTYTAREVALEEDVHFGRRRVIIRLRNLK